jgi:hypothetical protein
MTTMTMGLRVSALTLSGAAAAACGGRVSAESKEVFVPAGPFLAGADCGPSRVEPGCDRALFDRRFEVSLGAFYADRDLVTRGAYEACVRSAACATDDLKPAPLFVDPEAGRYLEGLAYVNFEKAENYCGRLGKRLPTPHEFERLARGTDGRTVAWGDGRSPCPGSQLTLACLTYEGPAGARSVAHLPQWVEGGFVYGGMFAFEAFQGADGAAYAFRCARTADQSRGDRLSE